MLDSHSLTDLQERPRPAREPGSNCRLNGGNFGVVNGDRTFAYSDNANDPRCRKNREPVLRIEPAEDVTGDERKLNFLDSIRPEAPRLVKGDKPFIAFTTEDCCDGILVATPDSEGKPWEIPVPRLPSNPRTIGTAELLWYEGSFAIFEHATALSVPISYPKTKTGRWVPLKREATPHREYYPEERCFLHS